MKLQSRGKLPRLFRREPMPRKHPHVAVGAPLVWAHPRGMSEDGLSQPHRRWRCGENAAPPLILLVEDNEDLRELYAEELRRLGYRTAQADNGLAGLEAAREAEPAVVLLDYHMPIMDGFEAARRLREDPRTRDIPLVLVTSFDGCSPPPLLFDDRLDKPCAPERLELVIEELLNAERPASRGS